MLDHQLIVTVCARGNYFATPETYPCKETKLRFRNQLQQWIAQSLVPPSPSSLPLLQSMCQSGFPNVPDPGARAIFFAGSSPPHLSSLLWSSLKDERKMAKSPQKSLQEYSEFFQTISNCSSLPPPSSVSLPPSRSPISPWGDFLSLRLPILSSFFPANPNALDRCSMQRDSYLEDTEFR